MQKIRLDRYVSPRKLATSAPRSIERVLGRCMEKVPSSRYPTTQALIDDLMEFVSSRVPINHSARLVMFLREVSIISEVEAEELLKASSARGGRGVAGDRALVRGAAIMFSVLGLGVLGAGGAIQASSGGLSGKFNAFSSAGESSLVPRNAGYIELVVEPWANVYVDGEWVATTPTSARIALPPGKHYVKYKNPYFQEQTTEIHVRREQTQRLTAKLVDLAAQKPASGAAP